MSSLKSVVWKADAISLGEAEVLILDEASNNEEAPQESLQESELDYYDSIQISTTPSPLFRYSASGSEAGNNLQSYTIDEAIDKMGYGPFQFIIFPFSGLIWVSNTMVLMILAVLSPAVKCQWSLSSVEEAFSTSVVFVGYFLEAYFGGSLAIDLDERKCSFQCHHLF